MPPPGDLLAPIPEHDPDIRSVAFLDRDAAPAGALGDAYRAVTLLRAMPRNTDAAEQLSKSLGATPSPVPRFDLTAAQLQQRQFQSALETLAALDHTAPSDTLLRLARHRRGRAWEDKRRDRQHARRRERVADQPEYQFNLATVLH